jgi:thiosulfate dehydrogenase
MNRVKLYGTFAGVTCLMTMPNMFPVALGAAGGETAHAKASQSAAAAQGEGIDPAVTAQWLTGYPEMHWMKEELERHTVAAPADNAGLIGRGQGATYGDITRPDTEMWRRETYKLAVYGSTVFHSAKELRSTIGVSCDMCHPNASNTHPETYPKFQEQLGRVALLRDMINWCIEHPVKGKPLAADDPKMRGLEAYIYAQRKGTALDYGKH